MKHLPAARHSAFYWNTGEPSVFRPLQSAATVRASSTRNVEQARAAGIDRSTLHGLSKKADRRNAATPSYSAQIEGREAGQRSADRRDAIRRGGR